MISLDRQSFLAKEIINGMDGFLKFENKDRALKLAKKVIFDFASGLEDIDVVVKQKIASIKRGILEGTNEWKALYDRFYLEEAKKR